jgi:hypothetical protein
MGYQTALHTTRISATGGTRDLASIITSTLGGAGSPVRVYKFIAAQNKTNNLSPSNYFFNYLGGNRSRTPEFNAFYSSRFRR